MRFAFGEGLRFNLRITLTVTQQALRFDGVNQQSFLVLDPAFFPAIPPAAALFARKLPQQIQIVDGRLTAGQIWQTSIGGDR